MYDGPFEEIDEGAPDIVREFLYPAHKQVRTEKESTL